MSNFSLPKFVLGAGLTLAGVLTLNPNLIIMGGVTVLSSTGLLGGSLAQENGGITANSASPTNAIPIGYGKRKFGMKVVDYRVDPSDDEDLYTVGAWCRGSRNGAGVNDVTEVHLDGQKVADSSGAPQGVFTTLGTSLASLLANTIVYAIHYGTANQSANGALLSKFPAEWPSTARGRGVCWSAIKTDYHPRVHRGKPEWTAVIETRECYDPRDGAWKYTTNPGLVAIDYLLDPIDGPGADISEIEIADFVALANEAEQQVYDINKAQFDQWACNANLDTAKTWQENLDAIQSSFPGWIYKEGDKWRARYRGVTTPVSYVLNEDEIIGDFSVQEKGPADGANSVDVTFIDEDRSWEADNFRYPDDTLGDNPYRTADGGGDHPIPLQLPCETNRSRAIMHAARMLRESRGSKVLAVSAKESALQLSVGDVVTVDHSGLGSIGPLDCWVYAIEPMQNGTVGLLLVSYNSAAYLDFTQSTTIDTVADATLPVFNPPPAAGLPSTTVPDPTGLTLTAALSCASETQGVATVTASWTQSGAFIDHHLVRYREEPSGAWVTLPPVDGGLSSVSFTVPATQADYRVEVNAVSLSGATSSPVTDDPWGTTDTVDLTDSAWRTMPDASGIASGGFAHSTVAGVVTTTFTPAATGGRIFDLHVSSSSSFTPTTANRVARVFGADGTAIQWSYTPPVAGGEDYYFQVVVSDCFTSPLGETPDASAEFSSTYAGLDVSSDPGATSCVNIATEYGKHCAPSDQSDSVAEVAGDPYELIDLDAHCVPVGSKLSVGFDAYVVCSGNPGIVDQNDDGSLALTVDGLDFTEDFSSIASLDPAVWTKAGSPILSGGKLLLGNGDHLVRNDIAGRSDVAVYTYVEDHDGNEVIAGGCYVEGSTQDAYGMRLGGNWAPGKYVAGTWTSYRTPLIGTTPNNGSCFTTDEGSTVRQYSGHSDDWPEERTDTDHLGDLFVAGVGVYSGSGTSIIRRIAACKSRTVTVTGLTNMKIRVKRESDAFLSDHTETSIAFTGTGTVEFDGNDSGGGHYTKIEILDAGAGDAVVSSWEPARGVWGGDQYAFQPVASTCNHLEAEMAWEFLEADQSTVVSSGTSSRTNATVPGARVTIDGASALTRPASSRYLRLTPWKRNVDSGYICTEDVKVNQGTVATPFAQPFSQASAIDDLTTSTGDPGLTGTGGTGSQVVTQSERQAISHGSTNVLAPGDSNLSGSEALASSAQFSRAVTYQLVDIGRDAGDDVAFSVLVASDAGTDELRAVLKFLDDADAELASLVGSTVTASSLAAAEVAAQIPTGTTQIQAFAENIDQSEAWSVGRRMLVHGPLAREFAPAPITPRDVDLGDSGSSVTVDFMKARTQKVTLTAATVAITVEGLAPGDEGGLLVRQDSSGSRAIAVPDVSWTDGDEVQPSIAAYSYSLYGFVNIDGEIWATRAGSNMRRPNPGLTGETGALGFAGQAGALWPLAGDTGSLGFAGQEAGIQRILAGATGTLGVVGQDAERVLRGDTGTLTFIGGGSNLVTDPGE